MICVDDCVDNCVDDCVDNCVDDCVDDNCMPSRKTTRDSVIADFCVRNRLVSGSPTDEYLKVESLKIVVVPWTGILPKVSCVRHFL